MTGRIRFGETKMAASPNGKDKRMNDRLLSCDWGTSSFRLKLVDRDEDRILGELSSDEGAAVLYPRWKTQGNREGLFLEVVKQNIDLLSERLALDLRGIPVVLSGMVCSSIGLLELPYAPLPFAMDGTGAVVRALAPAEKFPHPVWLVSGVSDEFDVMRGEETQLIGLASLDAGVGRGTSVCIFPGTHSKHVRVHDGIMVGFKTFMTGELFHVLRHHSILKDSVEGGRGDMAGGEEGDAFCKGVRRSGDSNLLHSLFSIRVDQLFRRSTGSENLSFLSGLLIGTELRAIGDPGEGGIRLCSGSHVYDLYRLAIEELRLAKHTIFIAPDIMNRCAAAGQRTIVKNLIDY